MKHTATPWKIIQEQKKRAYYIETDSYVITKINDIYDEDYENAKFIVRAVNCHKELLEACKMALQAVQYLEDHSENPDVTANANMVANTIRQAIKRAEEGENEA